RRHLARPRLEPFADPDLPSGPVGLRVAVMGLPSSRPQLPANDALPLSGSGFSRAGPGSNLPPPGVTGSGGTAFLPALATRRADPHSACGLYERGRNPGGGGGA